jgi:hypothetical protein
MLFTSTVLYSRHLEMRWGVEDFFCSTLVKITHLHFWKFTCHKEISDGLVSDKDFLNLIIKHCALLLYLILLNNI